MNKWLLTSMTALAWINCVPLAQADGDGEHGHSDIEFGYDNLSNPSSFVIEGSAFTTEGFLFFEAGMEAFDPFDPNNFGSDEPGFTTNAAEGLLVNSGDAIFLRVLDASQYSNFGVGFVNFFNPNTNLLEAAASHRLLAEQNSAGLTDLTFNGVGIESGDNPVFLGLGDADGDVHDHIFFDLLDDGSAPLGAYGILVQLEADFGSNGLNGTEMNSDKFWMIWNHGMDEGDFDTRALAAFGAVPEPGTGLALIGLVLGALGYSRRRVA